MGKSDDPDSGDQALAASFGRCLTRHREAADVTMAKLAQEAGMKRGYIWRLEQGETLPSLRTIARISLALDVPVTSLLEGLDTSRVQLANRPYDEDEGG